MSAHDPCKGLLARAISACLTWSTSVRAFQDLEGCLPVSLPVEPDFSPHVPTMTRRNTALTLEANMGEVIRFIPKAERERLRLIREARAMYDSVFPSSDRANEQRDNTPIAHLVNRPNVHQSGEVS